MYIILFSPFVLKHLLQIRDYQAHVRLPIISMVVANRIAYLRCLAQHGAKLTFSVSINENTGIQKVKVVVDPSQHIAMQLQFCTMGMLDWLMEICITHQVADKGHKHSSGMSEVGFYISNSRISSNAYTELVETAPATTSPTAPSDGRHIELSPMQYPEWVPAPLTYRAVLEDPMTDRHVEHMTMQYPEWVPAPVTYFAVLEETMSEHVNPLNYVSLPCLGLFSV